MDILVLIGIGFFAQLIDGFLGLGYGLISNTFLIFSGVPVVMASASVHFAEVFTTLFSAISHFSFKNIDKNLMKKLTIPGVIGGAIGAFFLSNFNFSWIKIFVNIYLLTLGFYILVKFFKRKNTPKPYKVGILGFFGGLMDAIGGGGWGPIVTSNLVSKGESPQKTVGAVSSSEFFVTLVQSVVFLFCLSEYQDYFKVILCLLAGGILAAPLAAYLNVKSNPKSLILWIGLLIVLTNLISIIKYF